MKRLILLASVATGLIVTAGIAIASTGPASPPTLAQVASTNSAAEITTYQVADAGTIDVAFDGTSIAVIAVEASPGWAFETEVAAGVEVEVQFTDGVTRVDFKAEVEDGAVKTVARSRQASGDSSTSTTSVTSTTMDDTSTTSTSTTSTTSPTSTTSTTSTTLAPQSSGPLTIDASPAGSVTVVLSQGTVDVVAVDSNPGWTWSSERRLDGGVEVKFRNGSLEVEVEVEMEHGQMVPKVEIEDDSDEDNSGRGNADDDADDSDEDNSGRGNADDDADESDVDNSGRGNADDDSDDDSDDD